jgi:hypothetical protein
MKKYIISILIIGGLTLTIKYQYNKIQKIEDERDAYKNNTETLIGGIEHFELKEKLHGAVVNELHLKLSEFEKYQQDDARLIASMKAKNRSLEQVITSQLATTYELNGTVKDSIVQRDDSTGIVDTLRCVDLTDPWFSLHGCIQKDSLFSGTFESRDSLIYAETIEYKRFLGFLWKTNKIKNRKQEIVSRNPHTIIMGAEFITIQK